MSKVRRKRVVVCRNVTTYSLLEIHVTSLYAIFRIFTARNSSCGKVMFSHACIIPSVHGEGRGRWDVWRLATTWYKFSKVNSLQLELISVTVSGFLCTRIID